MTLEIIDESSSMVRETPRFIADVRLAFVALMLTLSGLSAVAGTQCGPTAEQGIERCVSGLSGADLLQMQQRQEASSWCWAASISMVLRRYGSMVSQEQIVGTHFGQAANEGIPAASIFELLNRSWEDGSGREVVSSARLLPAWRRQLGLVAPEVIEDLAQGKPLLIGTQQHAMVLVQLVFERPANGGGDSRGIRLLRAVVLDPASDAGVRTLRVSESAPEFLARVRVDVRDPERASERGVASLRVVPAL